MYTVPPLIVTMAMLTRKYLIQDLPKVLGRNPTVLAEEMQHLVARIEYLRDKKVGLGLNREELRRLVRTESTWLSHPVEAIENRIKFFQNQFHLHKTEFKRLIVSRPQVSLKRIICNAPNVATWPRPTGACGKFEGGFPENIVPSLTNTHIMQNHQSPRTRHYSGRETPMRIPHSLEFVPDFQVLLTELRNLMLKRFSMIEEMGFTDAQMKRAIRLAPKILSVSRLELVNRFQILHLDMGYDHDVIAANPRVRFVLEYDSSYPSKDGARCAPRFCFEPDTQWSD